VTRFEDKLRARKPTADKRPDIATCERPAWATWLGARDVAWGRDEDGRLHYRSETGAWIEVSAMEKAYRPKPQPDGGDTYA
jgi:hypothetical protein